MDDIYINIDMKICHRKRFNDYLLKLEDCLINNVLKQEPAFFNDTDSENFESYLFHVRKVYDLIEAWGVEHLVGEKNIEWVQAIVAFHGININYLPNEIKTNENIFELYKKLREVINIHHDLVTFGWDEVNSRNLQNLLYDYVGKYEIITAILLADSMSRIEVAKNKSNNSVRTINLSYIYMEIYESIAIEKGLYSAAKKCSDISFMILNQKNYDKLDKKISELEISGNALCHDLEKLINEKQTHDFNLTFKKSHISTVAKNIGILNTNETNLHKNILDVVNFWEIGRFIFLLQDYCDFYEILGKLYSVFPSERHEIKDYVNFPKVSGYCGIHSELEVYGVLNGTKFELVHDDDFSFEKINIKIVLIKNKIKDKVKWIGAQSSNKGNTITVLTPKNKVIMLPVGSSLIDFAFSIHSDIGLECNGGYVSRNNQQPEFQSIDYELKNRDRVELVKDLDAIGPTREWLLHSKTSRARNLIRKYIKSKRGKPKYTHQVLVKIIAIDTPGLTNKVAAVLSNRNLYSSFFNGEALGDGRARFDFDLLLTVKERELYIKKDGLKNAFNEIHESPILSIDIKEWYLSKRNLKFNPKGNEFNNYMAYFVGRQEEFRHLKGWLKQKKSIAAITGFYRAGKTTLVSQFTSDLSSHKTIYVNCNHIRRVKSIDEFWLSLLKIVIDLHKNSFHWLDLSENIDGVDIKHKFINACLEFAHEAYKVEKKQCLFVFDDIDVIDYKFGSMIESLLYTAKQIEDEIMFLKNKSIANIKIILIGQYKLYRYLISKGDTKRIYHLPISKVLDEYSINRLISNRLEIFYNEFPSCSLLKNVEYYIAKKIGLSPNYISIFFDLYLEKLTEIKVDNVISNERLVEMIDYIFESQKVDYNTETFFHVRNHYLNCASENICKVLEKISKSNKRGIKRSTIDSDLLLEINELIDFGFIFNEIDDRGCEWINLVNDWSSDFLCEYYKK